MFCGIRWHPPERRRTNMEPLAISVTEVTKVLGLGRTSIYAMIGDGRLEVLKLGRRTLIKTASIHRLIDSQS
jgi:excisionase family DNA binding protein